MGPVLFKTHRSPVGREDTNGLWLQISSFFLGRFSDEQEFLGFVYPRHWTWLLLQMDSRTSSGGGGF